MSSHTPPLSLRRVLCLLILAGLAAAAGCSAQIGLVGKWECDRTTLIGTPSEKNSTAEFFAPVPKFSIAFTTEGGCTVTWEESGTPKSKTGTYEKKEDNTLVMVLVVKFSSPEEQKEVQVAMKSADRIELVGTDFIAQQDGPFYMKRVGS